MLSGKVGGDTGAGSVDWNKGRMVCKSVRV